jgi:metal-responsive CopG/Arc/MetJ family transcriptional regulator
MDTESMTRRITITLPDELAARLDLESNASAFIAKALIEYTRTERTWEMLRKSGYIPTPESRARARQKMDDARARVTPESLAESERRFREILGEDR